MPTVHKKQANDDQQHRRRLRHDDRVRQLYAILIRDKELPDKGLRGLRIEVRRWLQSITASFDGQDVAYSQGNGGTGNEIAIVGRHLIDFERQIIGEITRIRRGDTVDAECQIGCKRGEGLISVRRHPFIEVKTNRPVLGGDGDLKSDIFGDIKTARCRGRRGYHNDGSVRCKYTGAHQTEREKEDFNHSSELL